MKFLLSILLTVSTFASIPTVNFIVENQLISEKSGEVTVVAQLSSEASNDVFIPFVVDGNARFGSDHNLRDGEFYISKGEKIGYITFRVFDDGVNENEESIKISLIASQNAHLGNVRTHEITVTDVTLDVPVVNFNVEEQAVDEGQRAVVVATLSEPATQVVTIPFDVTGTATFGDDHMLIDGQLIFATGSKRTEISVEVKIDELTEGEEDIYIEMFGPASNARIGTKDTHRIIINDLN